MEDNMNTKKMLVFGSACGGAANYGAIAFMAVVLLIVLSAAFGPGIVAIYGGIAVTGILVFCFGFRGAGWRERTMILVLALFGGIVGALDIFLMTISMPGLHLDLIPVIFFAGLGAAMAARDEKTNLGLVPVRG